MSTTVNRAKHRAVMLAHVADHEQSGTSRRAYCAEYGLSEQAAFSFLQRNAMDRRTAMRAIAQQVLDGDLRP